MKKDWSFTKVSVKRVVKKITIRVEVEDVKSVEAENDNGVLKTSKPFYPFTPQPLLKSNFSVGYQEAFAKKWTNFTVKFKWKEYT